MASFKEQEGRSKAIREDFITRTVARWDKFFSGPEHDYNAAIQNYDYMEQREAFVEMVYKTSPNLETLKKLIIQDYKKWWKNVRHNLP